MHDHVIWCITYHRCHMYFLFHMVMSYDPSPTFDAWSCHVIHYLPTMPGHVISYITYHRCMIMSSDTSPTIDALSCHMIHHLSSMHGHVLWYITYLVIPYDTSPTIDALSCLLIHHLPSMHGHVLWYIIYHRWFITYQWYIKHHLPSCNVINQLYRYMIM